MKTTRTITIYTCDRCKEEVPTLQSLYGKSLSNSVCDHEIEYDLCEECDKLFTRFMDGKPVE
jgi:hypothetical protein